MTLSSFKEDYQAHRGSPDKIASVCCDMSPAFIGDVGTKFPNASITFDKFHIMKIVNEGIDMVRREEQAINEVLKKTRYIWLKNPDNLTKEQNKTLGALKE